MENIYSLLEEIYDLGFDCGQGFSGDNEFDDIIEDKKKLLSDFIESGVYKHTIKSFMNGNESIYLTNSEDFPSKESGLLSSAVGNFISWEVKKIS